MGRRGNEILKEEMLVTYPVRGEGAGPVSVEIHGQAYTPEDVSAEVLKKLRRDAEAYFNEPVTRAVALLRSESRDVLLYQPRWIGDPHAGRVETSMMLALAPQTVQQDRAVPGDTRTTAGAVTLSTVSSQRKVIVTLATM